MNEFKKRIINLFLNHPFDYQNYLGMYKNKDYAYRIIQNLIPTDTGLEFEIGKLMIDKLKSFRNTLSDAHYSHWLHILNLSHSEDFETSMKIKKYELSIDLKRLYSLYSFMNKSFNDECRVDKSGIHIHTNILDKHIVKDFCNRNRCNRTLSLLDRAVKLIANDYFRYDGHYNMLEFNTVKGYAIIYRRDFNTIEYRCVNMTYNFRTLLKHIIFCHEITKLLLMIMSSKSNKEGLDILDRIESYIKEFNQI